MNEFAAELPPWVRQLRNDAELTRTLDLDWVSPQQAAAIRDDWLGIWNQVPYDEAFHEGCRKRLARCVPLAQGAARRRRLQGTENRLVLVYDPVEPEQAFVSLSHAFPALLWVRGKTNPKQLLASLRPYLREDTPSLNDLPRVVRMVKPLDVPDRRPIVETVEAFELWMDDASWASGFDDDPWRNVAGRLSMLEQSRWLRDVAEEDPGRFPAISWRTLWSRSVMRVEQHPMGVWVFELRYVPVEDSGSIDMFNEAAFSRMPRDLPVDLAASLLRGDSLGEDYLNELRARDGRASELALITCGLAPAEMGTVETIRRLAYENRNDEETLGFLADIASQYRFESLLFEMMALTAGTALHEDLRRFLAPERPPVASPEQDTEVPL